MVVDKNAWIANKLLFWNELVCWGKRFETEWTSVPEKYSKKIRTFHKAKAVSPDSMFTKNPTTAKNVNLNSD